MISNYRTMSVIKNPMAANFATDTYKNNQISVFVPGIIFNSRLSFHFQHFIILSVAIMMVLPRTSNR